MWPFTAKPEPTQAPTPPAEQRKLRTPVPDELYDEYRAIVFEAELGYWDRRISGVTEVLAREIVALQARIAELEKNGAAPPAATE